MKNFALLLRFSFLALLLAAAWVRPAVGAPSCSSYASGNLVFGTVNLLAGGITDSSTSITTGCSADPGTQVLICLSMEADPNTKLYDPRNLGSGSSRMAFNLYADAARTTIWGSTKSSSYPAVPVIITFGAGEYYKTTSTTVFGRIKASGQMGLPAGTYDTGYIGGWPMTSSSRAFTGSTPPSCASGGMTSSSATYYIQAVVNSDCLINSSTNMDFGTVFQTLSQNVDSTATITVTCNGGQSGNGYYVLLGNGLYANGSQRRMQGPGGYINYGLYQDAPRTVTWGNSNYNGVQGTGTGQPQSLTVYGRVPPQPVPGVGTFSDTVVITLSY